MQERRLLLLRMYEGVHKDLVIHRWTVGPTLDLAQARLELIQSFYGEEDEREETRTRVENHIHDDGI
jgi:hypothetical protein